jgi:glycosyltransferase involved in cell wall biosynthesis
MNIAVIIPALNEAETLPRLLDTTSEVCVQFNRSQVIVADNGSTDTTADFARAGGATVVEEPRRGYGFACAAGLQAVEKADAVVFLDADFSFDPREMPVLLEPIQSDVADLVLGSRFLSGNEATMLPHQRFGNWLTARIMQKLYSFHLTDLGPYRAIRYGFLKEINMQEMTFGWPTEMIVKAARVGARIVEKPVNYYPRFAGKSKVSGTLKGSTLAAYMILRTTFKYAFGAENSSLLISGGTVRSKKES